MALSALGASTLNYQLTAYAQGLWNDLQDTMKLAERLAPTTNVPGAAGQFKKFDDKNSFLAQVTKRAIGSDPVIMKFNATDDFYNCQPQALEIAIDDAEADAAGDQIAFLQEAKLKTLLQTARLSHDDKVATLMKTLSAVADRKSVV